MGRKGHRCKAAEQQLTSQHRKLLREDTGPSSVGGEGLSDKKVDEGLASYCNSCGRKLQGGFASFMPRYGKGEDFAREWLQEHQPSDKVLCGDVSTRYDAPISNAGVAGASFSPSAAGSLTQFSTASSHLRRRDPPQIGGRSSIGQKQQTDDYGAGLGAGKGALKGSKRPFAGVDDHDEDGTANGGPDFKHSQSLEEGDVWRMKVVAGRGAFVGFATESYDAEKHWETIESTVWMVLSSGTTVIHPDVGQDGWAHDEEGNQLAGWANNVHYNLLKDYTPKTLPYDVALRITKDGNLPQIQFNDDAVWHDFAPEGGTALKAGPWFPYLELEEDDLLSDHRVDRPRATKSAGMKCKPASIPAPAPAGDGDAEEGSK